MKKRNKILVFAIVAIIGLGLFSGCQKGLFKISHEKKAEWMVEGITDKLDLTKPQVSNLEAIKDYALTLRTEFKPTHDSTHQSLLMMLSEPTLDQSRLNELLNQRVAMLAEKAPEIIALLANFYDSLDVEQQQKIRENAKSHMENKKHHH